MIYDIEIPRLSKRISAWLLDVILLVVLVTGVATILTTVIGYDARLDQLDAVYEKYETQYGVDFDVNIDELTQAQRDTYFEAAEALQNDPEAMKVYSMLINLTILVISLSVLLAHVILEFVVPLFLKNGQTLGKKMFGIALMRKDGVRITPFMLFARSVLGKYTIETMIPLLLLMRVFFGLAGFESFLIALTCLFVQIVLFFATRNKSAVHDVLSCTVAVDINCQMIFDSPEAMEAYKARLQEERESGTCD